MARAITVAVNGVYQQINHDFVTKGHSIVFKRPPTGSVDLRSHANNKINMTSYTCTGTQTTFHLPAYPFSKFVVIPHAGKDWVPAGYVIVDVNNEIDLWIRENCPVSDWKWADQLVDDAEFGMVRLIIRESLLTFIATKWAE